ncbi:uncharacterized protein LOC126614742 isoform X2 [Malus sylvestris]|uniref:uncharacterized protein LOC126614742 isoform X2 n=1 Tax=Malus sylvestris TaxID=3752 RepID=UPI0021AC451E|nr:uncharacterized protein LOC126614742 isoform X2 [Malus sylvestris]
MASGSGSRPISGGPPLPAPLSDGDGKRETLPETPWYDLPIQNVASGGFTPPFVPEGDCHGTVNLAKIWGNSICVAGSAATFHTILETLSTMVKTFPHSDRTVYEIAYHFSKYLVPPGHLPAQSLVMGWDNTSVLPHMYCATTSDDRIIDDHTFAIGSGANDIPIDHLNHLRDHPYEQLGHVVHDTMSLLTHAAMLDPHCGGVVLGRILKKDTPPKVCYKNYYGP